MSPSVLTNLQAAKANVAAILAQITADPKPSYSIDGQSVSWESYFSMLTGKLEALNKLIQVEGGPFEQKTQALPGGGNGGAVWPV
jgi:hypothetical protein